MPNDSIGVVDHLPDLRMVGAGDSPPIPPPGLIHGTGTGLAHRSVSQVSSFAQCGEAYRLSRVAKVPQRPAAWFPHGTAYHAVIEEYENTGRTLTKQALADRFINLYQEAIAKMREQWPDENDWITGGRKKGFRDIEDREAIGVWQVLDYVDFAKAHEDQWRILPLGDGKIATEVEFHIDFGGVDCFGFIDQIRQYPDGSLEVADLKTGTSTPGSAMQLAVYAYVVQQNTGILPVSGVFVKAGRPATAAKPTVVKPATPTWDIQHRLHGWDKSLLDSIFSDMDRAEKAGIFLPNPQDGCERTCTVSEYCRIKGWGSSPARFATITTRAVDLGN